MERKITALSVQKRNPKRVNVHLDGEYAFGLSRITAAWLEVGQVLSESKIGELQAADKLEAAYQTALNFLSFRLRSENEVRSNLLKHNFSEEVILAVLARLNRNGLVDDRKFAQTWVENRSEFRPRSCFALKVELHQKGIDEEVIEEVLNSLDEDELAYQAAQKQFLKYAGLEWVDFRQKMTAFLARRGFPYAVTAPIVEKIWSQRPNAPDNEG
jgi:regulatory protein